MEEKKMTHKDLVKRAGLWLRNNQKCSVVICERATRVSETPDAIGFVNGSTSILIECKASRADFLADKGKFFRQLPEHGVGDHRYYFAPKGIIQKEEIGTWGLIEVSDYQCKKVKESEFIAANKRYEVAMLTSMIRRVELAGAVFIRHEEIETTNPTEEA